MEQWKGTAVTGGTLMDVSRAGFLEMRVKQPKERIAQKVLAGGEGTRRKGLCLVCCWWHGTWVRIINKLLSGN